jgi:hypothetical protein
MDGTLYYVSDFIRNWLYHRGDNIHFETFLFDWDMQLKMFNIGKGNNFLNRTAIAQQLR